MSTLEDKIERDEELLEKTKVPGTEYTLMDYIHGRCQIFAQALHEELGYEMEFLWDDDYWFEDDDVPSIVLVHAYCVLPKALPFKGKYVDARGVISKRMMEFSYECNSHLYEECTMEKLETTYKNKILEKPSKQELKCVREYIRNNMTKYK